MSFLGGLFKKKPGGTFFGNLLRGVTNKATGGLLGNGANMIPLPPATDPAVQSTLDQLAANQKAMQDQIIKTASVAESPPPAVVPPAIDLGKLIKLPTIETGVDSSTKNLLIIGGSAVLGLGLIAILTRSNHR